MHQNSPFPGLKYKKIWGSDTAPSPDSSPSGRRTSPPNTPLASAPSVPQSSPFGARLRRIQRLIPLFLFAMLASLHTNGAFTVCFLFFFCQRFLDTPQPDSRQILHAGVLWFQMCLLPFWMLAAPGGGGGKRGK